MNYGIKLDESDQAIIQKLNRIAAKKITANFYKPSNIRLIEGIIRDVVKNAIRQTKTWQSLHGNDDADTQLDAHFGIPKDKRNGNLEDLLTIWGQEIKVIPSQIKYGLQRFEMSYDFYAIEASWGNVLQSSAGITENITKRSISGAAPKIIPWLHWILVGGDSFNPKYEIRFTSSNHSRSGKALMKIGGTWSIPEKFGPFASNDNFVTRALAELGKNKTLHSHLNDILRNIATPGKSVQNIDLSHIDLSKI